MTTRFLGVRVERPDLHARDTLREQALGQLAGPVEESIKVFVWPLGCLSGFLGQSPVAHLLAGCLAHVAVARAGVVGPDLLPPRS